MVKQENVPLTLNKRRVCQLAGTLIPRGWTGKAGRSTGAMWGPRRSLVHPPPPLGLPNGFTHSSSEALFKSTPQLRFLCLWL